MTRSGQAREPLDTDPAAGMNHALLGRFVRADQLAYVRRSGRVTIPVNVLLSVTVLLVSLHYGHGEAGLAWFLLSTAINIVRVGLYRRPQPDAPGSADKVADAELGRRVDRQLRDASAAALLSGLAWAGLPLLCEGYTGAQTVFYIVVSCGITAGAVTHGTAYARIPIAFITPPILSAAACLLAAGGFDRTCLGLTVLLYLIALIRSSVQSEAGFRETSRLTHEARALASSLGEANDRATEVADEMTRRATHDALTGLLNRAGFLDRAERQEKAARSHGCLMMLDLDGFKSINDAFGHQTGDRILIEVARRLAGAAPDGATVARLGGDEFAVFYDRSRCPGAPADVAAGMIASFVAPFETLDAGRLGMSIGICTADDRAMGLPEMLTCADEALYAAKASGRNRFCLFDEGLRNRLEMRRDSERDLGRALAEHALELWFQPIYGDGGLKLSSLEALVRWRHPKHGWVPPPDLISAAAMAGLSEPLLRFILESTCSMISTLRARGHGDLGVAMNVSPREMAQIPVDEIVLDALARFGLPARSLEIEITEETAIHIGAVEGKLARLSAAGVRVAVDDFGVGFSSLSSLRQIRVDRVKIDRCFVTGIARSTGDRALVRAVLGLGQALGFEVVAEGVETEDDLRVLQAAGCRFMQGYHLGRPMPAEHLLEWVRLDRSVAA